MLVDCIQRDVLMYLITFCYGGTGIGKILIMVETGESRTPRPEKTTQNLLQVYPVFKILPG